jgi:mycothiol system anti-sigma-R factor
MSRDHDEDPPGVQTVGLNCTEAVHVLYHFLDGELTPERRLLIEYHLDSCSPCLEAFEFEIELRDLIKERCREQVPDELRHRIKNLLASEEAAGTKPGGGTFPPA